MTLISFIRQAFPFRSSRPSEAQRSTPSTGLRPPTTGQRREDVQLWKAQLKQAQGLHARLERAMPSKRPSAASLLTRSAAPDMPLQASTRVLLKDSLPEKGGDVLHASWLSRDGLFGGGSMVMASPRVQDSRAWASACAEHKVAVVVDLGSPEEARTLNHCMRSTAPAVFDDCSVAFMPRSQNGLGFPEETRLSGLGEGAVSRPLKAIVRAHVDGGKDRRDAVPANSAVSASLPALIAHDMAWLRIPSSREEAIGPRALLDVCRHLRTLGLEESGTVAFMSPGGDRRSAVFGAAWDIQRKIDAGGINRAGLPMLVEGVCQRVRAQRHPSALDAKEDIASLLAFATLALEARLGNGRRTA
ncbi:hypothetical protein CDL60_02140 [Roseateles noduli]|nr:hypothetical protein CDL60_02140 [Roseateles noduli]